MLIGACNPLTFRRCAIKLFSLFIYLFLVAHVFRVTVLFPWNHWGNTTGHREPDANFVDLLATIGADGFNTDSGGRPLIPGEKGYTPDPNQVASHSFDGTGFVKQGLAEHLKFGGGGPGGGWVKR